MQALSKPTRVGVITPGKIGNSVIRHKVARKIRAAAAEFIEANPEGYEIVVRAQVGSESLEVSQWLTLFNRCKP
ncbi:MAG: Ribonuclease [Actinomycetota bacterium]